ncbi:uncharacterized protein PV09_09810 [Verruconis gallopava]|uniref:Uncharacterized protein n=1 Tax=Verruconis gallopava TaxID=253628 RepID=A0A0D1ZV11_9PEZI|nr:uncharacterized protein PV09_09810 [Verruconis gallopava]KIV98352.1 hypothetical protein PV09_09810 [Verruconis gallopava]
MTTLRSPLSKSSPEIAFPSYDPPPYSEHYQDGSPIAIESRITQKTFQEILYELLIFDSQISPKFSTADATYSYTCGNLDCNFTCGVPHLMIVVRVKGQIDDQIGIILRSTKWSTYNILRPDQGDTYSFKAWRNSRFFIIRRMLLCLQVYNKYRDMNRVARIAARPFQAHVIGYIMGKVLNVQKALFMDNLYRLRSQHGKETDPLSSKGFYLQF